MVAYSNLIILNFEQIMLAKEPLTDHGPVTQYCGGSIFCKNPIFFTMKEFPQI